MLPVPNVGVFATGRTPSPATERPSDEAMLLDGASAQAIFAARVPGERPQLTEHPRQVAKECPPPVVSGLPLAQTHPDDLRDLPYLLPHTVRVHERKWFKLALKYRSFPASKSPLR